MDTTRSKQWGMIAALASLGIGFFVVLVPVLLLILLMFTGPGDVFLLGSLWAISALQWVYFSLAAMGAILAFLSILVAPLDILGAAALFLNLIPFLFIGIKNLSSNVPKPQVPYHQATAWDESFQQSKVVAAITIKEIRPTPGNDGDMVAGVITEPFKGSKAVGESILFFSNKTQQLDEGKIFPDGVGAQCIVFLQSIPSTNGSMLIEIRGNRTEPNASKAEALHGLQARGL